MKHSLIILSFLSLFGCSYTQNKKQLVTEEQAIKTKRIKNTVMSHGHPIAVWEKSNGNSEEAVLLVHGRTWSGVPDFDLQVAGEDVSLMDALLNNGYAVYAIDLRGYGGTPRDSTQWLTPDQAAKDIKIVLEWINGQKEWKNKPHLFGWSMGSSNAQLTAQRYPDLISSLILFGYWVDADYEFPADDPEVELQFIVNTAEAAASDFLTPGENISQNQFENEMPIIFETLQRTWELAY